MKKFKAILLIMFLFCIHHVKSQNVLKPENVFNLYFDSFVKYNDESLKELNSYLINFLGKDYTYKMPSRDSYNERVNYFTKIFLSNLPEDVAAQCKDETHEYFTVLLDNFKDAKYTIKSITSVPNKHADGQHISEVTYLASFRVPSDVSSFKMQDFKKAGVKEMKRYLKDLSVGFRNADKTVSVEEKFILYQSEYKGDIYYWNGGPEQLVWKLNEFYFNSIR